MDAFLEAHGLCHLLDPLVAQGLTIPLLLDATLGELQELVPFMADRIRLRRALESYRADGFIKESPVPVTLLGHDRHISISEIEAQLEKTERGLLKNKVESVPTPTTSVESRASTPLILITSPARTAETNSLTVESVPTPTTSVESRASTPLILITDPARTAQRNSLTVESVPTPTTSVESRASTPLILTTDPARTAETNSLTKFAEEQWEFVSEIGVLEDRKPLIDLLQQTTYGRTVLEKKEKSVPLTPQDRKSLVRIIVEHELRQLPCVVDTIRQEVWISWANEISRLFPSEVADVYYVPYKVTERQAFPASGLLHNRLITHRRNLKHEAVKKKVSSKSSSEGSETSSGAKRHRPLPQDCICESASANSSEETSIKWLEESSSPFEMVMKKWTGTFKLRQDILKKKNIREYFQQFPALGLPSGHKLLESDFDTVYSLEDLKFDENFPIVKKRLLELLVQKGISIKADSPVSNLLELATVGEEQGSIAALRAIPLLFKQVAPITKNKKSKWKPSRIEVSNSFITYVSSVSDVQRCLDDRAQHALNKCVAFGPLIIAVGPSWAKITQYEVAVTPSLRYEFDNIKSAIKCAFKIFFALDIEYPSDSAPCWMFVQRTIFKITTKFDTLYDKSVSLRELISECL